MAAPGTDWWDLLLDSVHKAIVTVSHEERELHNENLWSAGHLVVDVANEGYTRLLLTNNGLKEAHINFKVSVEGKAYLKAFRGGLHSNQGTSLAEVNHVGKSTATTDIVVTYNPTVTTPGTQMLPTQLLPGGIDPVSIGIKGKGGGYTVPPADNFYIEVQNQGGAAKDDVIELTPEQAERIWGVIDEDARAKEEAEPRAEAAS